MKKRFSRVLCVLLALVMVIGLCSCGKDKKSDDPNHFDFGDYTVDYKGSCIMSSESGDDAVVMTFDFTNNSKENASYGWTIFEKAMQDGIEMTSAYVVTDMETYESVSVDFFTDVAPGNTIEVSTAYLLSGTSEVTLTLADLWDKYTYTITVDPATLSRTENDSSGSLDGASGLPESSFLNWWNGDWYGWWVIKDGSGTYDEYDGYWWDVCAKIEAFDDLSGCIEIWDEEGSYDDLCGAIEVSFSEAGTGDHGTMFSESGVFLDSELAHADWIVDPGLLDVDDLIWIDGIYYGDEGDYSYEIFLRPWGTLWDDITEDITGFAVSTPSSYDWYLNLVNAGNAMPNSFSETASGNSVSSDPAAGSDGAMKLASATCTTFYDEKEVTTDFSIPEGTWCVDNNWDAHFKILNSPTVNDSGFQTPEIRVDFYDTEEDLTFYVNDFEGLADTDGYKIGGIDMKGRTYNYIGINGIVEYYAQLPSGVWVSVQLYYVAPEYDAAAAQATCYSILDTFSFK